MFPSIESIYRSHLPFRNRDPVSARICAAMEEGEHVEVDFPIVDYAADLAVDYSMQNMGLPDGVSAPDGGRLFAKHMLVSVTNVKTNSLPSGVTANYLFTRGPGEMILKIMLVPAGRNTFNGKSFMVYSGWTPGKPGFLRSELLSFGADQETVIQEALQDAFLLSVLNQERFVTRESGGTRQQRRSFERQYGFEPIGWHRVKWNIGEAVKAKVAATDPENAKALHFCRAHWRHAKEGQPKAIRRNDAPGWWCWVSECWKGHPAFGIRLHHYTPKLKRPAA